MTAPQCGTTRPPWEGGGGYPGPNQPGKGKTHLSDTPGGLQTKKPSRVSNDLPLQGILLVRGQSNYLISWPNLPNPFV